MSNDLNMCQFIGRLVDTPELRQAGQTAICNFTIACGWKTKDKEGTEYIRCVAYSRLAEVIAEYMVKGQQMYVSGRQTTRKYDDAKGVTKYSTEVIADRMQMLAKPQGQQAEAKPVQVAKVGSRIEDIEDSIPF